MIIENLLLFQVDVQLGTSATKKGNTCSKVAVTGVAKVTGLGLGVASWTLTSINSVLSGTVSVAI